MVTEDVPNRFLHKGFTYSHNGNERKTVNVKYLLDIKINIFEKVIPK